MKKIMCLVLCAILLNTTCLAFDDINDPSFNDTITDLAKFGIINGYSDGSFKPDNNITRAEFSKMIICATGYNYFECEDVSSFVDVDTNHWGTDYIYTSKKFGIVNGTTDTTFEPEANITYEQAIKMIVCALGYGKNATERGGYPYGYIEVANELGLLDGITFEQTFFATRKNIALIINKALDIQYNYMYEFENEIIIEPSSFTLREMHNIRLTNTPMDDGVFGADNVVEEDTTIENAVG